MNKNQIKELHPLELRVLLCYDERDAFSPADIVADVDLVLGQANQSISWLLQRGLIQEKSRTHEVIFELTELGKEWLEKGSPSQQLLEYAKNNLGTLVELASALNIEQKEVGSAFGVISKSGFAKMNEEKQIEILQDGLPEEVILLNKLLSMESEIIESALDNTEKNIINQYAKKRGSSATPFKKTEREVVLYALTSEGLKIKKQAQELGLTGEEIGMLTPEMLKTGAWKDKSFRRYNTELPPNRVSVGRRNPYAEFLQQVKDKLVGLGFEEFDGSLVQTEFWNSDALFMPQFHPARDIHDVYYVKQPTHAKEIEEPWLSHITAVHENGGNTGSRGWGYKFDKDFAKRLILRSQGTVLSAQQLPTAKIPGKYFGILRVFRHDQVDATHLSDFYQTEGIILGDDVNIRTLLGLLKVFAEEFAHAEEVKYVPGYFPFTEPSVEVHIKHPEIGWMELGGSGIFRPEVTKSLGVDVPVAAWGIGIDRMATMQMKINDLRDLFTNDLEKVIYRTGVKL